MIPQANTHGRKRTIRWDKNVMYDQHAQENTIILSTDTSIGKIYSYTVLIFMYKTVALRCIDISASLHFFLERECVLEASKHLKGIYISKRAYLLHISHQRNSFHVWVIISVYCFERLSIHLPLRYKYLLTLFDICVWRLKLCLFK